MWFLQNWIFMDYTYFKKFYKLIAIDLSKQQKNFIIEEVTEKILDFPKEQLKNYDFNSF